MIKCILFDVFDVLIYYTTYKHHEYVAERNNLDKDVVGKYLPTLEDELDRGTITAKEFVAKAAKQLKIPRKKVYYPEFFKKNTKPNRELLSYVRNLRKDYTVAFLSNTGYLEYGVIQKLLNVNDFDYRFMSCYIGLIKPNPKIFRYSLKKMGLEPDEVLFIDDRISNIRAARKVGLNAIQFKGNRDLKAQLLKLNIG